MKTYEEGLSLTYQITQLEKKDTLYESLKAEIKKEKDLYQNLGFTLIAKEPADDLLENYDQLVALNENRYHLENDHLKMDWNEQKITQIRALRDQVVKGLETKIEEMKKDKAGEEKKIASTEHTNQLSTLNADLASYEKLKASTISDTEQAIRSAQKQEELVKKINESFNQIETDRNNRTPKEKK